ncbi:DUF3710 domain-containing protein [Georgenia sp. MJ173]|uniref:DUF3710 domain-containing protein n=1 Tax=Georgenia sunbinii TaxID=3117728 RepID=UPI002F25FFF9
MALFSRRRKRDEPADTPAAVDAPGTTADEQPAAEPAPDRGPWDVTHVPELGTRIDLGALRVPARPGLKLRMEVEKKTGKVVATSISVAGSALQVQAFAAPRTQGLWDELRPEIAASVEKQGGTADEVDGPFGRELLARLPVTTPEGRSGHRPARFLGVDGPRWFLRGVISGRAAIDPDAAARLEELFADVVVVRGTEPRAPRDVLHLTLPTTSDAATEETAATDEPDFDPTRRGPEITEIR